MDLPSSLTELCHLFGALLGPEIKLFPAGMVLEPCKQMTSKIKSQLMWY